MKLKTYEFHKMIQIANTFKDLSKFFDTPYKEYVRLFSCGDGILYSIVNNCEDIKIIQKMDIDLGVDIDRVYLITEIFNIVKNVINYPTIELDANNMVYFPDGKYSLITVDLSDDRLSTSFNLDFEDVVDDEKTFTVDEEIQSEIKSIFKVLNLKSSSVNNYFYDNGCLYFNFRSMYVKKQSKFSFMITDIFSLRMISLVLLNNRQSDVYWDHIDEKLIMKSDHFYIETSIYEYDTNFKSYTESYFANYDVEKELDLKLEFFNFVDTINNFDNESTIVFNDSKVEANSKYKEFIAEFNITDIDDTFVIETSTLHKILNYYIKDTKEDKIRFKIINTSGSKFLYIECSNDVYIISEVI